MEPANSAIANQRETLRTWIRQHESNGIKQHTAEWLNLKNNVIGGSSIATIQGVNPYSSIATLIGEKIGIHKFVSNIRMQWGNLFEDVIKRYVEHDRNCEILGEDLYVEGPEYTAYSPDGIAVFPDGKVVLCEFKCPYSRIPTGKPPAYYVPQVKMGLDVLGLPQIGVLIEAVFRKCTWSQIGPTPAHTVVGKQITNPPLAYGIIGFYANDEKSNLTKDSPLHLELWEKFDDYFVEKGDESNNYQSMDLGDAPEDLFALIMDCFDKNILSPWFGEIVYGHDSPSPVESDKDKFSVFCRSKSAINFGILPWKLFRVDYNFIDKEPDYLQKWMPTICEMMKFVKKCNNEKDIEIRANMYNSYLAAQGVGFSDD